MEPSHEVLRTPRAPLTKVSLLCIMWQNLYACRHVHFPKCSHIHDPTSSPLAADRCRTGFGDSSANLTASSTSSVTDWSISFTCASVSRPSANAQLRNCGIGSRACGPRETRAELHRTGLVVLSSVSAYAAVLVGFKQPVGSCSAVRSL